MPRPKTGFNKSSLKNLKQYQELEEDELDEIITLKQTAEDFEEYESKIEAQIKEFEDDYDLSDMKINDLKTLRALAQASIALDELEFLIYLERKNPNLENITIIDKLGKQASDIRSDISRLQNDLNITRKTRKGDREDSIQAYIEKLKVQAKEFYEQKMSYILCPKCNMLLATAWFLYPDANNVITLECHRELDNGEECGTIVRILSNELVGEGSNKPEVLPLSMV